MKLKLLKYPAGQFEKLAWADKKYALGIDEAGRGCLAGPVVVGAVVLPLNTRQPQLKDSKVMTAAAREKAFEWITQNCWWTIALADHQAIDTHNIYQATLQTMRTAYLNLSSMLPFPPEELKYVLIDAMPLDVQPHLKHPQLEFVHFNYGESISPSIAAASIVAKVIRDRMMDRLDESFPAYNFKQHKGYGTPQHIAALKQYGPCLIHRTTFITNLLKEDEHDAQIDLFC